MTQSQSPEVKVELMILEIDALSHSFLSTLSLLEHFSYLYPSWPSGISSVMGKWQYHLAHNLASKRGGLELEPANIKRNVSIYHGIEK